MALPASVLSSSSTSHEVTSRSYSTILPRRDSEQSSPMSAPVVTTSSSSSSKAEAATPSTLLSLKPSRSQARKSASGSGSGSTATATRRRGSSNAKLVDQETRDLMRKVSHSAIERRRRERINDKILQLKHLVPACVDEDHLHKLSILQSTIEYIQHLKSILPASVANIKVGRATNNNPNNKTTDMLDAMGGSISAKSPLTPLMTTGLNHFHAKRIKVDKPDIRALLEEHSPGFASSSSDEDAKDGLLLLAGQSAESTTDQSSRHDKRALRKKRSME
ncbi:hypothetical protein BGX34_000056 [Mortierella sp. NVP85]|nr:hypothetical protein BGX34_000056 [Mortierella sp. NVP85]